MPGAPILSISAENLQDLLKSALAGSQPAPQTDRASLNSQDAASVENLLGLALRQSSQSAASVTKATASTKPSPSREAPVVRLPEAQSLQQIIGLLQVLGGEEKQASHGSSSAAQAGRPSSSQPTASASATSSKAQVAPSQPLPVQSFLDREHRQQQQTSQKFSSSSKADATQPSSSQAAPPAHNPHLEGLQQFFDLFIGGLKQQAPQVSSHASKPQPTRPEFGQFINSLLGQHEKAQEVN